MFYNNLKKFIKKFPPLWKFLTWHMDRLIVLSRLKDVLMMMILFHVWPEQTYRFSTRKLLPSKKNRFSKESKPVIPYNLLKSKSSNIPVMKEANAVGMGSSFDLNDLKKFDGPTFLISYFTPLRIDNNGNIYYDHPFSHEKQNVAYLFQSKHAADIFYDKKNKEFKKDNLTYVNGRKLVIERFRKNGNKVITVCSYMTDKDENLYPMASDWETSSYRNLFDHDQCKLIAMEAMIYKSPLLPPDNKWAPSKSFLSNLCALSFFAEKINVYGWDFYLDSSPENMSYWQLFFSMYKHKQDLNQSRDHFESALINFYYGYQLSKLPNFKINGYMGKLDKHHKLIKRIERVLFN